MPKLTLKPMIKRLEKINKNEITVVAKGQYPDKRGTLVRDVAKWQNDGTERIKPSHFLERTIDQKKGWSSNIKRALSEYLFKKHYGLFRSLGNVIARDISRNVDRIKTGRMKKSFKHVMKVKR